MTPGFHVLGRETFLAPVEWVDGWPVVAPLDPEMPQDPPGAREPVAEDALDHFDGSALHPRWVSVRRPADVFASLDARPGWLTLAGQDTTLDSPTPTFLGRRQQHHLCRARTLVEAGPGVEAGLAVVMDEHAHYEVAVIDDRIIARARIGPLTARWPARRRGRRPRRPTALRVETRAVGMGPDVVCLGFEHDDGTFEVLAELDGRYLSTEVVTGFTGRLVGMYAVGGGGGLRLVRLLARCPDRRQAPGRRRRPRRPGSSR